METPNTSTIDQATTPLACSLCGWNGIMAELYTDIAAAGPILVCPQCRQCKGLGAAAKTKPVKLNLGCCDAHLKGYTNVDIHPPADVLADLNERWPWDSDSVESIRAWDIFEHLPSKIGTMNEAYRVLMPGGTLELVVPTTDGRGAFQDPTHRSFWTPNDLFYYCEECPEWQRFHVSYGIHAHFRIVSQEHGLFPDKVWKLRAVLQAVKA
jgi:hypothetical protein